MAEDSGEKRDWKATMVSSIKNSFGLAGRTAVEAGKEKVVNLLDASKNVLSDYTSKALETFNRFPNKTEFANAAFMGAMGLQFVGLTAVALRGGIPADVVTAGAATFAAGALFLEGSSAVLFREWHQKSFGPIKSETK